MNPHALNEAVARIRGLSVRDLLRAAAEALDSSRVYGCECGANARRPVLESEAALVMVLEERAEESSCG